MHKSDRYKSQHGSIFEPRNTCGFSTSSYLRRDGNAPDTREEYDAYGKQKLENNFDTGYFNCSSEMTATTESVKAESGSYSVQTKIYSLPKSRMQVSGEQYGAVAERKGQLSSESSQTGLSIFSFLCTFHISTLLILYTYCRTWKSKRYIGCTGK